MDDVKERKSNLEQKLKNKDKILRQIKNREKQKEDANKEIDELEKNNRDEINKDILDTKNRLSDMKEEEEKAAKRLKALDKKKKILEMELNIQTENDNLRKYLGTILNKQMTP